VTSCTPSIFAGMSPSDLQAQLTALQQAYLELQSGERLVSASYSQGDGTKNVSFAPTDMARLTATIRQLQQELGIIPRARRSLRFVY
jgi:hypothetical protein